LADFVMLNKQKADGRPGVVQLPTMVRLLW